MIKAVLIFNNQGKPRLLHWFQQMDVTSQQNLLKEVHRLVHKRPDNVCNFLEGSALVGNDTRIIYRHYATLYFVFVADSSESELGILDLIQVFVEALDRTFVNVCELDLIFRPEDVTQILGEIISGGLVLETNIHEILATSQLKKSTATHR
ncbi:AP complex, mu/sigma subunit [Entophlyctis helioformis]|nr:AP complex, mu/sigma subunit [Entophlyctis helioformis]